MELGIVESEGRDVDSDVVVVIIIIVVVAVVEATRRLRCFSLAAFPEIPAFAISHGREENDDGALRPIIFPSLRNISTPLQRTNSFYSRCRATLRWNRIASLLPRFSPSCVVRVLRAPSPSLSAFRDPNRRPPLNADRKFPHYFNCARTAIIHPRAKKIIKCL